MTARPNPFSLRAVVAMIAIGFVAFAAIVSLLAVGDAAARQRPAGANAFSEAAVGHRALVEALEALDIPVLVSRARNPVGVDQSGVMVLAEPRRSHLDKVDARLSHPVVLYVLPKRAYLPDHRNLRWIAKEKLLPVDQVEAVLRHVAPKAEVTRTETPQDWDNLDLARPEIAGTIQLATGGGVEWAIGGRDGGLLGFVDREETRIWILADPDLMANHGLGRGENAAFMVHLLDWLRRDGTVVVDETIHGFARAPNLWGTLFEMPFAVVTLVIAATVVLLGWAAAGRFGTPRPAEHPIRAGKETLIDTVVDLLADAGTPGEALRRYRDVVLASVVEALPPPKGLDEDETIAWLDQRPMAGRGHGRFAGLSGRVETLARSRAGATPAVVATARKLHLWKRDMIHGSGTRPRHRR